MATYSPVQVYALARKHGGSPAWALGMVGVVATESGGVTDQVQPNGKGRGLVQIDLGEHPDVTEAQAFDPDFAMAWAYAHSHGDPSKLGAPLFYGPRDHPADASKARAEALAANPEARGSDSAPAWQRIADGIGHAVDAVLPGSPVETAKDVAGLAANVAKAALWLASPRNWSRVVEVLIGVALVLGGLWRLSPATAGAIRSTATRAAELVAVA